MRSITYQRHAGSTVELTIFEDQLEQITDAKNCDRGCDEYCGRGTMKWNGREWKGSAELFDMLNREWPEGLEILDRMERELEHANLPRPMDRRRRLKFRDDDGDEIDLDRLRDGREFWRLSTRQFTQGPTSLTLMVDLGVNCSVSAEQALWRGAACVNLANVLEQAGYRVEIWAVQGTKFMNYGNKDIDQMTATCLKRTSDPMDKATLLNGVATWYFRSVIFSNMVSGAKGRKYSSSLGSHHTPTPAELRHVVPSGPITYISSVWNFKDATAFVKKTLEQLNAGELSRA